MVQQDETRILKLYVYSGITLYKKYIFQKATKKIIRSLCQEDSMFCICKGQILENTHGGFLLVACGGPKKCRGIKDWTKGLGKFRSCFQKIVHTFENNLSDL